MTLAFDDVSFRYPGAAAPALDHVSWQCEPGSITWLYHTPGAGASTALLLAAGIAPRRTGGTFHGTVQVPHSGEHAGALLLSPAATQLSGIAATVREEVAFTPAALGRPRAAILEAVDQALAAFGIESLAGRDPATLSGGETQRVLLAAAWALQAPLLLLDAPENALDQDGRDRLQALLRQEAARGAIVLIADTDPEVMAEVADHLVVLDQGRVVYDGAPDFFLAGDAPWTLGIGSTMVAELARAAQALAPDDPRFAAPSPWTIDGALARWGA